MLQSHHCCRIALDVNKGTQGDKDKQSEPTWNACWHQGQRGDKRLTIRPLKTMVCLEL